MDELAAESRNVKNERSHCQSILDTLSSIPIPRGASILQYRYLNNIIRHTDYLCRVIVHCCVISRFGNARVSCNSTFFRPAPASTVGDTAHRRDSALSRWLFVFISRTITHLWRRHLYTILYFSFRATEIKSRCQHTDTRRAWQCQRM